MSQIINRQIKALSNLQEYHGMLIGTDKYQRLIGQSLSDISDIAGGEMTTTASPGDVAVLSLADLVVKALLVGATVALYTNYEGAGAVEVDLAPSKMPTRLIQLRVDVNRLHYDLRIRSQMYPDMGFMDAAEIIIGVLTLWINEKIMLSDKALIYKE